METSNSSSAQQTPVPQDLQGHGFYRPGVIATYCVLSLPVGLYLYGVNVARRGGRVMGYVLSGLSGATFLGMLVAGALGARVSGLGILGIFAGIGLLNMEGRPYRLALSRGGVTSRWWPPLLWVIGSILVVTLVVTILGPEEVAE